MGIAALDEDESETIEILLERADHALYVAKNAGRNQLRAWRQLSERQGDELTGQGTETFNEATPG